MEERIARGTDPAIVVEHVARYRFALALIDDGDTWLDLGCGNGCALQDALGSEPRRTGTTVLADVDADALATAARELRALDPRTIAADLADPDALARIDEALAEQPDVVTCFETIEHLDGFEPLVRWLLRRAEQGTTFVLSVPNDAFWSMENPYHLSVWGEGAVEELRSLLPADHVAVGQFPLYGTLIAPGAGAVTQAELDGGGDTAAEPSHFLLVCGPRSERVRPVALASRVDTAARRSWERDRDANLAWLEQRAKDLEYLLEQERQPSS